MAGDVTHGPACAIDGSCCGPDSPCCPQYTGSIDIRRARASDIDSISGLLSSSDLPLDGVADTVADFYVAEAMGTVVGSVGIETHGEYGLLRSAAVSEALRGRGVGRRLVTEALNDASRRGMRALYLLTTTAEEYFPSFGFEKVERSSVPAELNDSAELKGACPASATVMRRGL